MTDSLVQVMQIRLNTETPCSFSNFEKDKIDHIFRKATLRTEVYVLTCLPPILPDVQSKNFKLVGKRLSCLSKLKYPHSWDEWRCLFGKKLVMTHKHESRFSALGVRAPFIRMVGAELGLYTDSAFTKWQSEHSLVSQQRLPVSLLHKSPAWDPAHQPE